MTVKAKKVLKNIDFSKENAHIALVGPAIGGPANGADYALVVKALDGVSPEFVQKMQQIKVTLETPDFLRKFFGLYYEDAEVLARLMGYVDEDDEDEVTGYSYENYIKEQLDKFEVVKSLKQSNNIAEIFKALGQEEFLKLLTFQSKHEDSVLALDRLVNKSTKVAPATEAVTSTLVENNDVEANASEKLEKSMDQNEVKVEMVEKAQLDSLVVELQKAKETIDAFKAEKAEAVAKARKQALVDAVKDEAKADVLFKSLSQSSDEEFNQVVKTLGELSSVVEKSALFEEKGAAVETQEPVKESGVMKALKSQKIVK